MKKTLTVTKLSKPVTKGLELIGRINFLTPKGANTLFGEPDKSKTTIAWARQITDGTKAYNFKMVYDYSSRDSHVFEIWADSPKATSMIQGYLGLFMLAQEKAAA